ncbi:MAG: YiiX/YebB-like N1pC/P60 family cysteine hydrolase [Salibacteraceae bacterium]
MIRQPVFFLIMIALALSSCQSPDNKPAVSRGENMDDYDFSTLENGDIVLKAGHGMISQFIIKALDEPIPISHVALIAKEDDSLYVIHSVARQVSGVDGVQTMSFYEFLKDTKKGSLFVLRHKASKQLRDSLIARAKYYLDQRVPFDHRYDLNDQKEMYCTEFVYSALKDVFGKGYFKNTALPQQEVLNFNPILSDSNFISLRVN